MKRVEYITNCTCCLHFICIRMTKTTNIFEAEDVPLPSSEDEEPNENIDHGDLCTPFELEQMFRVKYRMHDESSVSLKKEYILSLCKDDSFTKVAAGLSNAAVHLFDIGSETGIHYSTPECIKPPPVEGINISGVRFLDESPNLLLVGSDNGLVRLFDLRSSGEQARFDHVPEQASSAPKKSVCFDRNCNSRVLCVGTEQHQRTAYLLFYDLRCHGDKVMGAYFECHDDDVTSLKFHPDNPDILCSGSTDGLINIYDLKQPNEDDALLNTINTESSVHKLNWHKDSMQKDVLSCITNTNDFLVYEGEEGDLIAKFEKTKITQAIQRSPEENHNLINAYSLENGDIFFLTSSYFQNGSLMRSLCFRNKEILPYASFEGNHQIVRESVFDLKSNVLVTAGESGIVSMWKPHSGSNNAASVSNKLKIKSKKSNKTNPY